MKKLRSIALCTGVSLGLLLGFPGAPAAAQPASPSERPAADYLVRFREDSSPEERAAAMAAVTGAPASTLEAVPGLQAELTASEARELADSPVVAHVERDRLVRVAGTQTDAPWGLDRIDQGQLPLSGTYTSNRTGRGVKAYVLDTGINSGHSDLAGRVAKGVDLVGDGYGTGDCYGHGTRVAGVLGGTRYGVAKRVTLIPVRILDCAGSASAFDVVKGIDWVIRNHRRGTPAVANLSFSGGFSDLENTAVRRLIADGVTVVAAAGNVADDACQYSPGAVPGALTVAASDEADQRASFSNFGSCVDLYAPGARITSASGSGDGASESSGTSLASPHVAGAAALILSANKTWSPAKVAAALGRLSVPDQIGDNPEYTPNRLLGIAPSLAKVTPAYGPLRGGKTVTITGTGLRSVRRVLFDGVAGTHLNVKSDSLLTVRAPARRKAGEAAIVATSSLSSSNRDLHFAYGATQPAG